VFSLPQLNGTGSALALLGGTQQSSVVFLSTKIPSNWSNELPKPFFGER